MFTEQFDSYAIVGESIELTEGSITYTARIEFDQDTRPDDYDCFDAEDIKRWERDEWFFAGVVISASCAGVTLDEYAASLWGIEVNFGRDNDYLTEVANELLPDARVRANEILQMLKEAA